jgi:hypothetical protein
MSVAPASRIAPGIKVEPLATEFDGVGSQESRHYHLQGEFNGLEGRPDIKVLTEGCSENKPNQNATDAPISLNYSLYRPLPRSVRHH